MRVIEVKNVVKKYRQGEQEIFALNDVSFSVSKGEFIAVIGASGSGKSTLIHILGCVDSPTSGSVLIEGKSVSTLKEKQLTIFRRRHIGLVYQFYNLIPTLNVEDNIKLPVLLDNKKIDEDYYSTLLNNFGLSDRLTHLPSELSGGQQQRVSIARALMNKPTILLLDEPTGNLDKENSQEVLKIIQDSHKRLKQTIILITHDEKIANFADRIIKLEDGKIVHDGATV